VSVEFRRSFVKDLEKITDQRLKQQVREVILVVRINPQDQRIYCLTLQGGVDEEFVAAYCPAGTTLTCTEDVIRLANIRADQTSIVGLVRHLHNLGCVILALES